MWGGCGQEKKNNVLAGKEMVDTCALLHARHASRHHEGGSNLEKATLGAPEDAHNYYVELLALS